MRLTCNNMTATSLKMFLTIRMPVRLEELLSKQLCGREEDTQILADD